MVEPTNICFITVISISQRFPAWATSRPGSQITFSKLRTFQLSYLKLSRRSVQEKSLWFFSQPTEQPVSINFELVPSDDHLEASSP